MAQYQNGFFLTHVANSAFDTLHAPGAQTPFSGIYRCAVCGLECVSVFSHALPPQNHHQHAAGLPSIRWQLLVASSHR